jgi:hypothetical protein
LDIQFYFFIPKLLIRSVVGFVEFSALSVPKISINKYRNFIFFKSHVWFAENAFVVFSVAVSFRKKRFR